MSEINMIPGVHIAASGLAAQRARLEVIAANIANASTTRGPGGQPYRRKIVHVESGGDARFRVPLMELPRPRTQMVKRHPGHVSGRELQFTKEIPAGVRVSGVEVDQSPFPQIYDPSHPDANEQGYVEMPNVDLLGEMVDLMLASRVYEANLAVLEASRENAKQALDLMR
jgi:flagellar basal-body rod protein FlgC